MREAFEGYHGRKLDELLLTTNHVVAETVTLLLERGHTDVRRRHQIAVRVGRELDDLPGWTLSEERSYRLPDPRPKLKTRG